VTRGEDTVTDRPTVLEVIVTAAVQVAIPKHAGDHPRAAVESTLGEIPGIRHVSLEELGEIVDRDDHLAVETYSRLTIHLDPETSDAVSVTRGRLAAAESVIDVQNFQVASGPYTIESW